VEALVPVDLQEVELEPLKEDLVHQEDIVCLMEDPVVGRLLTEAQPQEEVVLREEVVDMVEDLV